MKLRVTVEGRSYEVEVDVLEEGQGSPQHAPRAAAPPAPSIAPIAPPHHPAPAPPPPARPAPAASSTGGKLIKAPIVGTVLSLKVKPGDTVQINEVLVVMEAMKMETNVASPLAGVVKKLLVAPGEAVKADQALVELE